MYLQQSIVLGRATKDAEVLESKGGKKYAKFSVAVNEYLGKDKEEKTTFYDALVFNKTSENADLIKKGDLVLLEGRPDVDPYISKEGEAKASLLIYAEKWRVLK